MLTASNIAANTKKAEAEAEGQHLMNQVTEVELGMKPDMLSAELDDLKESANQKRQAIKQSETEIDKIKAEKDKLVEEKEYIIAQEGLVEYEKRVKEAEAALKRAEEALANANKELADVNKEIQEKERDNYLTPAERIEKQAKESAKATVDETPQGRIAKMYEEQMNKDLEWIDQRIRQKAAVFGENHNEVRKLRNQRNGIIRRYRNKIRRINKSASVGGSAFGFGVNAGG